MTSNLTDLYKSLIIIIHEQSTKKITTVAVVLYLIKHMCILTKFLLRFSQAYSTSILKILWQTNSQDGYKMDRF